MNDLVKKARAKAAETMHSWVGKGYARSGGDETKGSIGELLTELANALEKTTKGLTTIREWPAGANPAWAKFIAATALDPRDPPKLAPCNCGAVMHMTGGYHTTDCPNYEVHTRWVEEHS